MQHDKNDARLAEGERLRAIRPTRQGGLLALDVLFVLIVVLVAKG
jgi:hypothetical protein